MKVAKVTPEVWTDDRGVHYVQAIVKTEDGREFGMGFEVEPMLAAIGGNKVMTVTVKENG